ncbi:mechanosensitive ion channel family protein [Natronocalculus amylovorans]|uniref:Mechanosensitive ion channel family protein n=1 Tax=Natronocalculus amylovorans TaxID=2917812 RepID=A0AAE3K890_9EURY|nr:mechanosensitive ion channel family protein [Natronocalculus amylovorans]MCL9816265.1 mechanosensitive ion channel family protein [Natronocalculus amylovorans]NUE03355.1 mechanosensitive ion channel family protein [Halorubraceae archaeon YAN]
MLVALQSVGDVTITIDRILITIAVVVGVFLIKRGVKRLRRSKEGDLSSMTNLLVSTLIAGVTASGVFVLIATWGLSPALQQASEGLDLGAQVANIILSIIVLGGAYALTDFLGQIIKEVAKEQDAIGQHEREMLHRSVQVGIYTVSGLIVLGLFTDNLGGLFVGAGFLGIVVGMAARQTLGAVLAGFVLMFSRPFEVGDWVVIGENEGTVTDITIVNTRIQSFDGEYVMIPNDVVSGTPIVNRTRRGRLRTEVEVGIDYDVDPDRAAQVAKDAAETVDRVLDRPEPQVIHKRFDDSAIVLGVRFWITNPTSRRRVKTQTAVISAIRSAFETNGIKIPFPQRELMARNEAGGFRLTEQTSNAEADRETEPDEKRQGPIETSPHGGEQ